MLINPATCFDRSVLAVQGPETAQLPFWIYPFGLLRLLPLLTDEYSMDQLFLILQSKALPSVIDNETREAYLGRVALSLPQVIPYMAQETLQWRLTKWLATGCARLAATTTHNRSSLLTQLQHIPSILVVGENDKLLPSVQEAQRLSTLVWSNPNNKKKNSTLVLVSIILLLVLLLLELDLLSSPQEVLLTVVVLVVVVILFSSYNMLIVV